MNRSEAREKLIKVSFTHSLCIETLRDRETLPPGNVKQLEKEERDTYAKIRVLEDLINTEENG